LRFFSGKKSLVVTLYDLDRCSLADCVSVARIAVSTEVVFSRVPLKMTGVKSIEPSDVVRHKNSGKWSFCIRRFDRDGFIRTR